MTKPNRAPLWTAESFHPIVTGEGANKLADSQVAPLVAQSRGYYTVTDTPQAKALADRSASATGHRALANTLVRLLHQGDEDLLVIPWYRASGVAEQGTAVKSRTTQYRPSLPEVGDNGKTKKYVFLPGESTTLDFNPATPIEWITAATRILMTEGAIKGDAALTAQLLAAGVEPTELALAPDGEDARLKLHELMQRVPKTDRVLILSFAGVANWHGHTDWYAIKLAGRTVMVAFDGDMATNWNVWRQASKLVEFAESKNGHVQFLNLGSIDAESAKLAVGLAPETKLGLDDYLAKVGTWSDALLLVEKNLPPEPERADHERYTLGAWRVSPTRDNQVEEFAQEPDGYGGKKAAGWVTRYNIGGRIASVESRRRPVSEEIRTGVFQHELDAELTSATCTIEIVWIDDASGDRQCAYVTGPATILNYQPADWVRQGASIPNPLLLHPEWPPRKGLEWLSAIKAHRAEDTEVRNGWDTMGWVPVEDGNPVFIAGDTKIGRTVEDEKKTVPGVTERILSGASSFGLIDTFRDEDVPNLDAYKKQVRDDIRLVLDRFIESGVWTERHVAVTAVCTMIRPAIPLPINASLYIFGPPGSGKSFTASFIMSGWQKRPGTWTVSHLPGAAGDTLPATEYSIARTPIWVADDLAPSVDRRKAEQQEAQIGELIRAVHNGSPRRKMDPKTGIQQTQAGANCMFIVTAENEPQTASVRDRVIAINTPANAFGSEEQIEHLRELCDTDGAPARLVAAVARHFTFEHNRFGDTWAETVACLRNELDSLVRVIEFELKSRWNMGAGPAARHARIAAEIAISFQALAALAEWAGIDEGDPILARLAPSGPDSYTHELTGMAARLIQRQRETTPGRSLVQALSKLMLAGRAHVENPNSPGTPPAEVNALDGENAGARAALINRRLGWVADSNGVWSPKGVSIGYYGYSRRLSNPIVLFDVRNAFGEARNAYPELVLPGQNATVGWASVWNEGLCAGISKRRDSNTVAQRLAPDASEDRAMSDFPQVFGVPVDYRFVEDPAYLLDGDVDEEELGEPDDE